MIEKNEKLTNEEVLNLLGPSELDFLRQHKESQIKTEVKKMEVKISSLNEDDLAENWYNDEFEIQIDGERVFKVHDGEPEDNNLSRNFNDVYKLDRLLRKVYHAGKDGIEMEINYEYVKD